MTKLEPKGQFSLKQNDDFFFDKNSRVFLKNKFLPIKKLKLFFLKKRWFLWKKLKYIKEMKPQKK